MGPGTGAGGARPAQAWLKAMRVAVAAVFLGGLGWAFLNLTNAMPPALTGALAWPQFVPSLLQWIGRPALAAAGFAAVLAATVLFGRVYCSAVCPLGLLQDLFSRLSRRFGWVRRFRHTRAVPWVRYGLLAAAAGALAAGVGGLLGLLDPFSIFGKIMTDLARPAAAAINNIAASRLDAAGVYFLYRVDLRGTRVWAVCAALGLLALPLALSLWRGRLYCNTVCPVGTLLGLAARVSLFRIRIDAGACTRCADCASVCKAECIDLKSQAVDDSRCVGCFNCVTVCAEAGIRYEPVWPRARRPGAVPASGQGRREFIGTAVALVAAAVRPGAARGAADASGAPRATGQPTRIPEEKHAPVSPPGSAAIARFNRLCTGCGLCVAACPSHVLKPALLEYGLAGLLQPRMDFTASFCEYDCIRCGEVCPTGAILPLTVGRKHAVQTGRVVFIKDNCVVQTQHTACGSCAEHCPSQAVHMVPFEKNLTIPEIDPDRCVGCGACEQACPTRPYRAIYVDGNPAHRDALPPKFEKPAPMRPQPKNADFPF